MPAWAIALLAAGGAMLALGARVGSWWRGRSATKEKKRLESDLARATTDRDVAVGTATVATAQNEVLTEHVAAQTKATAVAEEVRDAASSGGPSASDRIGAVDAWVHTHEGDASPVRRDGTKPGVRKP